MPLAEVCTPSSNNPDNTFKGQYMITIRGREQSSLLENIFWEKSAKKIPWQNTTHTQINKVLWLHLGVKEANLQFTQVAAVCIYQ